MEPSYTTNAFEASRDELAAIPWVARTTARRECFMSLVPRSYTYGSGRGVRTYVSTEMLGWVRRIMEALEGAPNVCFLNLYEGRNNALGWHSDDSPDTSDAKPISVVSFGEAREIWWREIGEKGVVPEENRRLLELGSLFVMPSGFQSKYEHRIPKGSRELDARISLTFRHMRT